MPAQCVYMSNLSSGSVFYCEISSDNLKDQRISRAYLSANFFKYVSAKWSVLIANIIP